MLELLRTQPAVFVGVLFALGLCVGSFLNVVIHRLPRMWDRDQIEGVAEWAEVTGGQADQAFATLPPADRPALRGQLVAIAETFRSLLAALPRETLVTPRSRCGMCGHRISACQNIPVLSFIWLRGRCSACAAAIGLRYPAIELLCGAVAALIAGKFGVTPVAAAALLLFFWLVPLAVIDAETTWLPNSCTLPLLWLGLILNIFGLFAPVGEAVAGAVAGYLFLAIPAWSYEWLRKIPQAMGRGDFTLMAALGAWFGVFAVLPIVMIATVVGLVVALPLLAAGKRDLLSRISFGPYLAGAGMGYLFFGVAMVRWIDIG